ncbi:MAG TPA: hypothetical protein VIK07_05435 [Bacteroidales bacterium]
MLEDNSHNPTNLIEKYKVFFFAGGETADNKFNIFTGSFIRLMKQILADDFELIKGIYFRSPIMNVIWALNNAQKPIEHPEIQRITIAAYMQIAGAGLSPDTQVIITSSSSGSIVAAQTTCYLAEKNKSNDFFKKPFHLVLGASMIAPESELFRQLKNYQKEGAIGIILHDEVQDEGDSSAGVGGVSRWEAYSNAFGLMFPFLSQKFERPSFLNAHPERGHIHRKRSMTVQKAIDYVRIILIENNLAGEYFKQKASVVLKDEIKHRFITNEKTSSLSQLEQ